MISARLLVPVLLVATTMYAGPVPVRHVQGTNHGFLTVRTMEGKSIAAGELIQTVHGDRVTSKLTYHFRDGSLDEETTVFVERNTFALISDHHVQRGPSFPDPLDILVEPGKVTVRTREGKDKSGPEKVEVKEMETPPDTYNGLFLTILSNLPQDAAETKIAVVAPTAKPRLVHLSMKPLGETMFSAGGTRRKARQFVLHVEIGGIAGVVAPVIGKEPKDTYVWLMQGEAPTFVRQEGQFYVGGPVWRVDQAVPVLGR